MSTTRRISTSELQKIKEIQSILKREGINLTQAQIGESLVEFTIKNIQDFLLEMKKIHSNQTEDRIELKRLLFESFEGEEDTDSVKEHDVIH